MTPEVMEEVIRYSTDRLEEARQNWAVTPAVYHGNQAVVNLLAALLREVAAMRAELTERARSV